MTVLTVMKECRWLAPMNTNTMKSTPTPGPWTLTRDSYRHYVNIPTEPPSSYVFSLRDEANARLIAAAPELLEAAKALVDCIDGITARGSGHWVADMNTSTITAFQMRNIRAAIARATL